MHRHHPGSLKSTMTFVPVLLEVHQLSTKVTIWPMQECEGRGVEGGMAACDGGGAQAQDGG